MAVFSNIIVNGAFAGLVAVIAMTLLMRIAKKAGVMPSDFNMPLMMGTKVLGEGAEEEKREKAGKSMHLMMGVVVGIIFGYLKGSGLFLVSGVVGQAVVLGIYLWLVMMVVVMPMMGKGLFGKEIGGKTPIMTLVVHLVFGLVLGLLA